MKAETKYFRDGKTLYRPDGSIYNGCKSINEAKAFSRKVQKENGGLGMGAVKLGKPK